MMLFYLLTMAREKHSFPYIYTRCMIGMVYKGACQGFATKNGYMNVPEVLPVK